MSIINVAKKIIVVNAIIIADEMVELLEGIILPFIKGEIAKEETKIMEKVLAKLKFHWLIIEDRIVD